jgi:hypothetical protein
LIIESQKPESLKLGFNFNLAHQILPEKTQIKYLTNKIEINLKKAEAGHWSTLEAKQQQVLKKIEEKKRKFVCSSRL